MRKPGVAALRTARQPRRLQGKMAAPLPLARLRILTLWQWCHGSLLLPTAGRLSGSAASLTEPPPQASAMIRRSTAAQGASTWPPAASGCPSRFESMPRSRSPPPPGGEGRGRDATHTTLASQPVEPFVLSFDRPQGALSVPRGEVAVEYGDPQHHARKSTCPNPLRALRAFVLFVDRPSTSPQLQLRER